MAKPKKTLNCDKTQKSFCDKTQLNSTQLNEAQRVKL